MLRSGTIAFVIGLSSGCCVAEVLPPLPKCNLDPPPGRSILAAAESGVPDGHEAVDRADAGVRNEPKSEGLRLSDENLIAIPVLAHIARSGATVTDLGEAHGLRMVLAWNREEFMLFQVAPDGEAVVTGIQADLPAAKLASILGSQATSIGEAHGLRGLVLRNGTRFQVIYETPDRERVIAGVMWDAKGTNLTKQQIASVEGARPTIVGGDQASRGFQEWKAGLELLEHASFGTFGQAGAPRLWLFVDPLCGYSVRALEGLRPIAASGQIELAVVPVAVLDDGNGSSTAAALAMLSRPSAEMVEAWSRREFGAEVSRDARAKLQVNMAVAQAFGLRVTPVFVWRKPDGAEGRVDGLPSNLREITETIGGVAHVAR
jgi:thiol:disulfide interchange protein DsbG